MRLRDICMRNRLGILSDGLHEIMMIFINALDRPDAHSKFLGMKMIIRTSILSLGFVPVASALLAP